MSKQPTQTTTSKVLPFEGVQGRVPGHEIAIHRHWWMEAAIDRVVFEHWDEVAEMSVDVSVHWTHWTQYMKKTWPSGDRIKGVLLKNGSLLRAKAIIGGHTTEGYDRAPILTRDTFKIVDLNGGTCLMEIVGVDRWLHSDRTIADTAIHLACPWERDNRGFLERTSHLA